MSFSFEFFVYSLVIFFALYTVVSNAQERRIMSEAEKRDEDRESEELGREW